MGRYILALDQGTSSSRAILYGDSFTPIATSQREFAQHYLNDSWVEHDPKEIWESQYQMAVAAIKNAGISPREIASIGITNQRETTIIWDRNTGEPIYNAIVWMCRRTSDYCLTLKEQGWSERIRKKTGLIIDAYFSATKIHWILENVPGAREKAQRGELMFGTVDTWLLYKLTGGKVHATDYTNASRTMMFNIHTGEYDGELLDLFEIPLSMLPEVRPSSGDFGKTDPSLFDGAEIPIGGIAGDQQAALFGHGCFSDGMAKNTYGTGCFTLMNTGENPVESAHGLVTTIAAHVNGKTTYALEGSVFNAGSSIKWLRDEMRLIEHAADSEAASLRVSDSDGVYVVPAFSGLGAPYWDMYARGIIVGLTRNTNKNHIIRATLESIAFQTADVLFAMEKDFGAPIKSLEVDGGACANNFLMQFQADILDCRVLRPRNIEVTALGAAYLAGLSCGIVSSCEELSSLIQMEREFLPNMSQKRRDNLMRGWSKAVNRSQNWAE